MGALFIGLAFNFALSSPVWGQELLETIPTGAVGDTCFQFDFPVPSEITYYLGHDVINTLDGRPTPDFFWIQGSLPLGQLGSVDVSTGVDFDRLVTLLTNGVADPLDIAVGGDNRPMYSGNGSIDTQIIAGGTPDLVGDTIQFFRLVVTSSSFSKVSTADCESLVSFGLSGTWEIWGTKGFQGLSGLENPALTVSGIGVVSGWKCFANNMTVRFNGGTPIAVAYGSERNDTLATCGDANNGFVLLLNYNTLTDGFHLIELFDSGLPFASRMFEVVTPGEEFLQGATATCMVQDFPQVGQTGVLEWNEAAQRFELVEIVE